MLSRSQNTCVCDGVSICACVSEPEVSVVDAINLAEINKQNQRGNSKPQNRAENEARISVVGMCLCLNRIFSCSAYNWSIK